MSRLPWVAERRRRSQRVVTAPDAPRETLAASLVRRGHVLRMPWGVDRVERVEEYDGVLCAVFGWGTCWRLVFSGRRCIVTVSDQLEEAR